MGLLNAFWLTLLAALLTAAQRANRAAVVVRFDDGHAEQRCVAFEEEQISGYELLERAGLNLGVRFDGMGAIMCSIEETGCEPGDCFCECAGGEDCVYWSYWHLSDGTWQYAVVGASDYQVSDGDTDGWSWGPGSVSEAVEPPMVGFEAVCGSGPGFATDVSDGEAVEGERPSGYVGLLIVAAGLVAAFVLVSRRGARGSA